MRRHDDLEQLYTHFQEKMMARPSRLDVLREIEKRDGLKFQQPLKDELFRLEKGDEGEKVLLEYLREFGQLHWKVLTNLWLDYYGEFECDLLLLTRAGLIPFEVKNYLGTFELTNNQCSLRGEPMNIHPLAQAQRVATNLKDIFRSAKNIRCLPATLAFVGIDNKVIINDQVKNIDIIARNELREHIWKINQFEQNNFATKINTNEILSTLSRFEKQNSFQKSPLPGETENFIRKGICCCQCGNFDLNFNKKYISCACGMNEAREIATLRTICEYATIYQKESYTSSEIMEFFNHQISRTFLIRILNSYFNKIGAYKSAKYIINHNLLCDLKDSELFCKKNYINFNKSKILS